MIMGARKKGTEEKYVATPHAHARCVERFGTALLMYDILGEINAGRFEYVTRLTTTRSLCWCFRLGGAVGQKAWFVLSRRDRCVVTVYPGCPEWYKAPLHEGRERKGGVNGPPTRPRPEPLPQIPQTTVKDKDREQ